MTKSITILLSFLLLGGMAFTVSAQNADDKIIISNIEETYTYEQTKQGDIQAKITSTILYKSLKPSVVLFSEYYDKDIEINDIKIKGVKGVSPKYGMYKQEDVFFGDAKVCYFEIPFRQKDQETIVTFNKIYKDIRGFNTLYLSAPYYVESRTIKIVVPDWMQIDVFLRNSTDNIKQTSSRDDFRRITTHTITVSNQSAKISENGSPDYRSYDPYLLIVPKESSVDGNVITYFKSVDDLYKWYTNPLADLDNSSPIVHQKAQELITNCVTDEERIRELSKWVQQSIRYLAFQDGISAYRPDDPQEVIAKKYGDCKGVANLLKALLVSVGFEARLTWVGMDANGQNTLNVDAPIPFANHMICALFWKDSIYYIDPTVKSLSFGEIPESIQGQKVLIEDGDKYIIAQIPQLSVTNNTDSLFMKYSLVSDVLIGQANRIFTGESKHSVSYWLNNQKEADVKRLLKESLAYDEIQDSIYNVEIKGLKLFMPEVSVQYDIQQKSNVNIFGSQTVISLDGLRDYENAKVDMVTRKTAIKAPYKAHVVRVVELDVPNEYRLAELPPNTTIVRDKYSFSILYLKEGDKITYRKEISIFDPILEKADFEQWNLDIDTLRKAYNELIVLEKK